MQIPEILEAFKIYDGTYKREYVDAAVELKDEITPYLINILEKVVSDPTPYLEDDDYYDHIYAVILLGYFGEPKAHQVLVDILNMPDDMPDQIFGDVIENFASALFRTCEGSMDKIKSVILNKDAVELCRSTAARSMIFAVADGMISREEALDFFGSLFTGTEAEENSDFWSFLASNICDLRPEELMPVIEKAYEDGLIDEGIISLGNFEDSIKRGKEYALEHIRQDMERWIPSDVHKYMSWWAAFGIEQESSGISDLPKVPPATISNKSSSIPAPPMASPPTIVSAPPNIPPAAVPVKSSKEKKKKKKKKKMAKASRRKNRR